MAAGAPQRARASLAAKMPTGGAWDRAQIVTSSRRFVSAASRSSICICAVALSSAPAGTPSADAPGPSPAGDCPCPFPGGCEGNGRAPLPGGTAHGITPGGLPAIDDADADSLAAVPGGVGCGCNTLALLERPGDAQPGGAGGPTVVPPPADAPARAAATAPCSRFTSAAAMASAPCARGDGGAVVRG